MANLIKSQLDTMINKYTTLELMQGYTYNFEFEIFNNGIITNLTGVNARIEMLKADERFIIQTGDISILNNKISGKIHSNFTEFNGKAKLQVILTKDNDVFGTWVIECKIKPSAINNNQGESDNVVTIIEELKDNITLAQEVKKETEDLIENGGAATKGDIKEINSQLEQIAINVETFGAKGDGVTDDTLAIQNAINSCIENKKNLKFGEGNYVISDTLQVNIKLNSDLQDSFCILGCGVSKTILKSKCLNKPTIKINNINNGTTSKSFKMYDFKIEPYDVFYKQKIDGLQLINCMGSNFENIYIVNCHHGLILSTLKNTSISPLNTGYCEQNVFIDLTITNCLKGITFRTLEGDEWNSSFHGNIFDKVLIGVNGNNSISNDVTALNFENGYIYNCRFDIKVFLEGDNSKLLFFNSDSGTNNGIITYECFDSNKIKIKTGDNSLAKFYFDGEIYGIGNIDWSEYSPIKVGEKNYNTNEIIQEGNATIGKEKFYANNLIPAKAPTSYVDKYFNPLIRNIQDMWNNSLNLLSRYIDNSGEQGFIMICKNAIGETSKFILGYMSPGETNTKNFKPGFEFSSNGKSIKSVSSNLTLKFENNNIYKNSILLYDNQNIKNNLDYNGYIHYPNGLIEIWGALDVSAGEQTNEINISEKYSIEKIFNVQTSITNNSGLPSSQNIVMLTGVSNSKFKLLTKCVNSGTVYWCLKGFKTYI